MPFNSLLTKKNKFLIKFSLKTFGGYRESLDLCTRFTKQATWQVNVSNNERKSSLKRFT